MKNGIRGRRTKSKDGGTVDPKPTNTRRSAVQQSTDVPTSGNSSTIDLVSDNDEPVIVTTETITSSDDSLPLVDDEVVVASTAVVSTAEVVVASAVVSTAEVVIASSSAVLLPVDATWHRPEDAAERLIITKLITARLVERTPKPTTDEWQLLLPSRVKRIEEWMYTNAPTLVEYKDMPSFKQRVSLAAGQLKLQQPISSPSHGPTSQSPPPSVVASSSPSSTVERDDINEVSMVLSSASVQSPADPMQVEEEEEEQLPVAVITPSGKLKKNTRATKAAVTVLATTSPVGRESGRLRTPSKRN